MLFSTHRSPHRSATPLTEPVDPELSLPRHVLVALSAITADVTSLKGRCSDAPEVQTTLGTIVVRIDSLVDSIYRHAAVPPAPSEHGDRIRS